MWVCPHKVHACIRRSRTSRISKERSIRSISAEVRVENYLIVSEVVGDGKAKCCGVLRGGCDVEGENGASWPEPHFDGVAVPGCSVGAAAVVVEGGAVGDGSVRVICYEAATCGRTVDCLKSAGLVFA